MAACFKIVQKCTYIKLSFAIIQAIEKKAAVVGSCVTEKFFVYGGRERQKGSEVEVVSYLDAGEVGL